MGPGTIKLIRNFPIDWRGGRGAFAVGDVDPFAQAPGVKADEIIVANSNTRFIEIFDAFGKKIRSFNGNFTIGDALAVGQVITNFLSQEQILLAGDVSGRICVFDERGRLLSEFDGGFTDDDGFAVEHSGGDLDGDGLLDTWEINGLTDANGNLIRDASGNAVLPPGRADPRHKDLFLEMDWMVGEQPTRAAIVAIQDAFRFAPSDAGGLFNPDGLPGIRLWVDTGALTDATTGDLVGTDPRFSIPTAVDGFGGGNAVAVAQFSPGLTGAFYAIKNGNFDPARRAVFRYCLLAGNTGTSTGVNTATTLNDTGQTWLANEWATGTVTITGGTGAGQRATIAQNTATQLTVTQTWNPIPDNTSNYRIVVTGGQAEIGGNDFIEYLHDSGTIMHEFGHTLGLRHGGNENANCKPNYISVMNYDNQSGVGRVGGGQIIDYSPPRTNMIPASNPPQFQRGTTPLPILVETSVFETTILDSNDPVNLFVFVNLLGLKVPSPLNQNPDYNANSIIPDIFPFPLNIDTVGQNGQPAGCANNDFKVLTGGFDDWRNIALSFRHFVDLPNAASGAWPERELTKEDLIALEQELNRNVLTTNVRITRSGFRYIGNTARYVQQVTLQNISGNPISGPLSLVVDSLSSNATLVNKTGVTANFPPLGSPFINVMIGADNVLNPEESVSVTLEFANPTNAGITYNTRVLTGELPP